MARPIKADRKARTHDKLESALLQRDFLAALDAGLSGRRAKHGVWQRVDEKVRRSASPAIKLR
ncbi:MAG TPA: hypothetical protein VGM90_26560 [Kofleriaceae bacterium]|jgi:hypothetical protein